MDDAPLATAVEAVLAPLVIYLSSVWIIVGIRPQHILDNKFAGLSATHPVQSNPALILESRKEKYGTVLLATTIMGTRRIN
jgi:hypothetical protein